jgi:titin
LTWDAPTFDGGSEVIDYIVWYDNAEDIYQDLAFVTDTTYIATGLDQGSTYKFKVKARNVYGISVFSNEVIVLAAQVPA